MKHAFRRLPSVRSTEHSHRHRRRPLQAMNRRAEASVPVRQIISFLHGGSSDTLAADVEIEPPHASASMSGSTTTSTSAPLRARARAIDSEQKQIKGDRSAAARLPRPAALRSGRPDSSKRKACGAGEAQDATRPRRHRLPPGGRVGRRFAPRLAGAARAGGRCSSVAGIDLPPRRPPRAMAIGLARRLGVARVREPRACARPVTSQAGAPSALVVSRAWSDATGQIGPACH